MKATARLLLGTTVVAAALVTATDRVPAQIEKPRPTGTQALIEAHEACLGDLQAERQKLKSDKSTFFNVIGRAQDLRTVELQIATRPIERVVSLHRFLSLLGDLEAEAKTPLDQRMIDAERAATQKELVHAKREAGQIERVNKQRRSLTLEPRQDLWRKDLDGSPMVHPILPPKLAERR
jgi:hypothetical protein